MIWAQFPRPVGTQASVGPPAASRSEAAAWASAGPLSPSALRRPPWEARCSSKLLALQGLPSFIVVLLKRVAHTILSQRRRAARQPWQGPSPKPWRPWWAADGAREGPAASCCAAHRFGPSDGEGAAGTSAASDEEEAASWRTREGQPVPSDAEQRLPSPRCPTRLLICSCLRCLPLVCSDPSSLPTAQTFCSRLAAEAGRQRRQEAAAGPAVAVAAANKLPASRKVAATDRTGQAGGGSGAQRRTVTGCLVGTDRPVPIRYKQLSGGCFAPSGAGSGRKALPREGLMLDHVHGYSGANRWSNIRFTSGGELVYYTAGVGIVQHPKSLQQRFFFGHDDDISALALHPDGVTVATGQVGRDPLVCVWDSRTMQLRQRMPLFHEVSVVALAFTPDGMRLLSVGGDSNHTFGLFELGGSGRLVAQAKGAAEDVMCVDFNGEADIDGSGNDAVSCGNKHCRFWDVTDEDGFTKSDGIVKGVGEDQNNLSLAILPSGTPVTGTASGDIYQWAANDGVQGTGNQLLSVLNAHTGAVNALCATAEGGFASGGQDGDVAWWVPAESDPNLTNVWPAPPPLVEGFDQVDGLVISEVLPLPAYARALAFSRGASTLAIGTSTNDILVVTLDRTTLVAPAPAISSICTRASKSSRSVLVVLPEDLREIQLRVRPCKVS